MITKRVLAKAFEIGMHQQPWEIKTLAQFLCRPGQSFRTVLEIGTDKGGTFHLWQALTGYRGRVVSVDRENGPWGSDCSFADRNLRWMQDYDRETWVSINGDSHSVSAITATCAALKDRTLDLLFLDGDHSYLGVGEDFAIYSPLVRPGGLVVLHDINDTPFQVEQGCWVHRFWNGLEGRKMTISEGREWGGLGIWEKPG